MENNEGLKKLITLVDELKHADGFDVILCIGELESEYKKQIDEAYQRGYKDGCEDMGFCIKCDQL